MGATSFGATTKAYDVDEAFAAIMHDVHYEYGHDHYNGHGGDATLGRCILSFEGKVTSTNQKKAKVRIKKYFDDDEGYKDRINYIDLGVVEYHLITVKKTSPKNKVTPKFEKRYIVSTGLFIDNSGEVVYDRELFSSPDKKVAEEKMLKYAFDYPEVHCDIGYVRVSGNDTISTVEVKKVVRASKPKTIPKGAILKELHEYHFLGWVSE